MNIICRKNKRNQQTNIFETSGTEAAHSQKQYRQTGVKAGRYMPGLDGLRALAVIAVIAYHLNLAWAPGGLLGVCLFFVLSGYLITDILSEKWNLSGRMDLKEFWLRRAKRLLPALYFMLAAVMGWICIFSPSRLALLWKDMLAAVLYVSNWWLIFHHVSYFASFGPPSPLGHLWSLAVEEQFYLFWPLLLWLGLRFISNKKRLAGLIALLALFSALAMALIYQPGMDPSRVYYGTDTRAFALLTGAALALVWPSKKLSDKVPPISRFALDTVGIAAFFIIILMIWKTNEYETFLYRGGLLIFSMVSAILVAVLAHPASILGRLFGNRPMRWLGVRSYGIYLWHYPIIILTSPAVNTTGLNIRLAAEQVAGSIIIAALSWYFIEEPIRHGNWRKFKKQLQFSNLRNYLVPVRDRAVLSGIMLIIGACCLWIIFGGTLTSHAEYNSFLSNIGSSKAASANTGKQGKPELKSLAESNNKGKIENVNSQSDSSAEAGMPTQNKSSEDSESSSASKGDNSAKSTSNSYFAVTPHSGKGITAIGDSVMVDVEPELKKLLPGIVVDAQIGRQMYQAEAEINKLKAQGELGSRVIIELGTNGAFTNKQLMDMILSLGKVKQIILINTRVPKPWENVVNQALEQTADTHPNIKLVNWYLYSSGHNNYFYPDGVHLDPEGVKAYASLVAQAINP